MTTTTTPEEREALRRWYGAEVAPRMEALFLRHTPEAYEEASALDRPGIGLGMLKCAARTAAWAIIMRSQDASCARGGAQ